MLSNVVSIDIFMAGHVVNTHLLAGHKQHHLCDAMGGRKQIQFLALLNFALQAAPGQLGTLPHIPLPACRGRTACPTGYTSWEQCVDPPNRVRWGP